MAFDVEGARKAGYSDAEIAQYLAAQSSFDLSGAKSSGYSDGEVVAHLAPKAKSAGQSTTDLMLQADSVDQADYRRRLAAANAPRAESVVPEPSIIDKNIGGVEAALTTLTGATGGAIGGTVGTISGLVDTFLAGKFGTPEGANMVERSAARGAQALTYQPRTPEGQRQAAAVGEVAQALVPIAPMGAEMAALSRGAAPVADVAQTAAAATLDKARTAAPAALQRIKTMMPGAADAATPTPGTMGSVGAAGTDMATMRRQAAESLPVPIKLTKGQAERSFEQQRFEQETAKDPNLGAPLRERQADQNAAVPRNFEAFIDETGARATSPIEVGRAVDEALTKDAAKAKAEYRVKYQQAKRAGEMEEPVSVKPLQDFLAENASMNAPELAGGSLGIAQREMARLGANENGTLSLADMELLRRQIGNAIDANPTNATNMRFGVQLRDIIDQQTDGLGGNLYREARAARRRYAQLYEDNAIVADLLKSRKGTADRQVALENVFRRTILNGTREDLSKLRRTLQLPKSEEGMQAWRELQGATLRHIIDESTSGVATDVRGNPIVSAAKMHRVIQQLDQGSGADSKLNFVLGKKGAQQVRDMNEIVKAIYTAPPGAVNTSNTASVILAAIAEAGATGAISGLPVPAVSTFKLLTRYVRDRQTRQRILQALGEAEQNVKKQPSAPPGATVH